MQLGMIGLGRKGANMARRLLVGGYLSITDAATIPGKA
jgi:6-phosphogluconate dehydrogenase (decarboxylating)